MQLYVAICWFTRYDQLPISIKELLSVLTTKDKDAEHCTKVRMNVPLNGYSVYILYVLLTNSIYSKVCITN